MGKPNATTIQTKIRAMKAETRQPMQKSQSDADSALRLMQADLQKRDKEHFTAHARNVIRSRKKFEGYQRILEALTTISDNSIDITSRASKEKAIPSEFAEDLTIVCNVGQVIKIASFDNFRSSIQQLYPKAAFQTIMGQDKLPDVIRNAFLHDGVTEQEFMSIYQEFASANPDFPTKMRDYLGLSIGMDSNPQMPQQMTQQIPGMPNQGYPQPQGIPQSSYPQMQGFPSSANAPAQQYQPINSLFVPVDIPEFTRDRWNGLSQAISEATS